MTEDTRAFSDYKIASEFSSVKSTTKIKKRSGFIYFYRDYQRSKKDLFVAQPWIQVVTIQEKNFPLLVQYFPSEKPLLIRLSQGKPFQMRLQK